MTDPFAGPIRAGLWIAGLALSMLGACTTRLEVRSQAASGAAAAYELRGSNLQSLQAEAARLCPNGSQVLRQWQRFERAEADAGFVRRWTVDLVDSPRSQAQLQVVCQG